MDRRITADNGTVSDKPANISEEDIQAQIERELPSFAGIDGSELEDYVNADVDWIVEWTISADQPTIFGSPSKALKTTQLVDLAVGLATHTKWLGCLVVPKRRRVLLITGESNRRAISKRIARALKSRGLSWKKLAGWLRVEAIDFPNLPNVLHQEAIRRDVERYGIDVVMVDPIYRGLRGLDARQMAEVGDAIISFTQACQPAAPIFSHHVVKMAAREGGIPTLEDLTGAGFAESCGNWWLIGRNQPYNFDLKHDLTVVFGGRDEQAGLKRIEFDEELWQFEISSGEDLQESKERERQQQKNEGHQAKVEAAKEEVKNCLRGQEQARPKRWVEDRSTAPQKFTRIAIAELLRDGELAEADYKDSLNRQKSGLLLTDAEPF